MGYHVKVLGWVDLPSDREASAIKALREAMVAKQGWLTDDTPISSLDDLASYACASAVRSDHRLELVEAVQGDAKWSAQATAFYLGLAHHVDAGEIDLEGEDGTRWSYRYAEGAVTEVGTTNWNGSSSP